MIKKLFFVLILVFLYIFAPSFFYTDCAEVAVNPKITLYSSFGKLKTDTSKNTDQLTELSEKLHLLDKDYKTPGLTTIKINFNIETQTFGFLSKNKKICVIPKEVTIFLAIDSPTIYISRDLRKNSCKYNLTSYHELTHHLINIKTFEYYLPLFKIAAEKIIKETKPLTISDKNQINKVSFELSKQYNKKLSPLVKYINKEMLNQQKFLDNEQNYKYESEICN